MIDQDLVWEGGQRIVFAAPDGDLTNPDIGPCEAIIDELGPGDGRRVTVLLRLEDGDLEQLQQSGYIWLTFLGGLPPFAVSVAESTGE